MTAKFTSIEERFWAKVDKNGPVVRCGLSACWVWTASKNSDGYGHFWVGRLVKAQRFSWVLAKGEIPNGLGVLHRCDNPGCVRPSHLFLGTQRDNAADMMAKGRQDFSNVARGARHSSRTKPEKMARGSTHGNSVLTESAVREIRRLAGQVPYIDLARRFGVTKSAVGLATRRETWRHVKDKP